MNKQEISNSKSKDSPIHEEAEILLNNLIREHATELKRIAYLYLNDQSECEDIVQEVYLSCYKNLVKFRNESSYKTWLIRITINKCKDHRKLWNTKNIIYKSFSSNINIENSAEEQYFHSQNSKEILAQIASLSPKFKEVLILHYFNGMTMLEISETLQIKHNTVKSRLLRGKDVLSKKLEGRI